MASQVPYSGAPEVADQLNPIAPVHADTPVAAFGGAVAGAITHMGETVQGAGKELFARAYAMQELNQQDIANAAVAGYQNELTQNFVDYTKKQGQDAIHSLPEFMENTETIRQKYAQNLPSQQAQFLFNQESRQARFRTVFSAGNYAREEMKKFSNESSTLRIGAAASNVAAANSGGYNPDATKQGMDEAGAAAERNAIDHGFHPGTPEFDQAVRQAKSHVATSVARELAKNSPLKAGDFVQDQLKAGNMTDTDAQNVQPIIRNQQLSQGSRSVGSSVLSGQAKEWDNVSLGGSRMLEVLHKASGAGGYETIGPEDPNGNGHPVGQYGVASSELPRYLRDAGMPAMSEEEFLKDHKAQDQLATFMGDSLQKKYGSFPEALKAWSSGIDTDNRLKLGRKAMADTASHSELSGITDRAADRAVPGDDVFKDFAKDHVQTETVRRERFLADDKQANYGTVGDALLGIKSPNGKLPTSLAELNADPAVREAYDKLDDKQRFAVNKALQRNINRGGYDFTPQSQAQFEKLYGIGVDPNSTPEDRQKLMDTDVPGLPMPLEARQKLRQIQAKVVNGAIANPQVGHGLAVMAPMLRAYGLTKDQNPDGYQTFVGAFHDALVGYGEGQAKAVKSDEDIQRIGMMLLRTKPGTAGWLSSGQKIYEAPGDERATTLAKASLAKQYGRDPTQEEVNNFLLRMQFQLLGGQAGGKGLKQ